MTPGKALQFFMCSLEAAGKTTGPAREERVEDALNYLDTLQQHLARGFIPAVSVSVSHLGFVHANLGERED